MLIYDVLHKETIYHSIANDLRNFGVKYRFKKSMFKTERLEGIKNISKKVFKTPLSYQPLDVVNLSSGGIVHVPVFVSQATMFLENFLTQEGLFRKAGSQIRQKELIARLDKSGTIGEKHQAIDVANCLKTFFRDLPEPLIPYAYHDLFVHCAMLKACRVQSLLLACILLPPHHLNTLAFFMEFLKKVSLYEKQNKMSIDNLAKVVGPNIMPLQEATMSAVQMRLELHLVVVKVILIENAERIGVLPDHMTQAISMETIGSTDNELDVSDCQSRSKSRKKKHRSGSLTRKPHLSASNLNLRMFNGLKKIVGKGALPEDNVLDNHQVSENYDALHASNNKSTKKRKGLERVDIPSTKKKRIADKTEKSKKLRLSLDRFVPKNKPKLTDEDTESYANNSYTERRWSSVSNSCDSQRKYRTYSDASSQLQLILKNNEVSNPELQKEYNNVFIDADVNLSDDSDEQVLFRKEDHISSNRFNEKLSSSSEELKMLNEFDQIHRYAPKKRLTLNDFETYSRTKVISVDDQSEEYVTIPKSEYEEIKNRVSAIESRLSQEFGCTDDESNSLSAHSVKKVQTAYEKTLEEASIESTASADYLAKRLGKELKIRRSGEHKIIRSPSARKIGTLRRRSQEKIISKRVRRTASWHISHGLDQQTQIQRNQELNNAYSINEQLKFSTNYMNGDSYLSRSTPQWDEEKNNRKLNNISKQFSSSDLQAMKRVNSNHDMNPVRVDALQPSKNRTQTTVRRVSSFHGNEFINTAMCSDEKVEKLRKTNSQQNIILNSTCSIKTTPKADGSRKTGISWKDAEGYFKSSNHIHTPVTQTGRASIAKLRTQNAGMVLAKAKLFDECTTKVSTHSNSSNKKHDWANENNDKCVDNLKYKEVDKQSLDSVTFKRNESSSRKSNKNIRKRNGNVHPTNSPSHLLIETGGMSVGSDQQESKSNYYRNSPNSDVQGSKVYHITKDRSIASNVTSHQKENVTVKTPPLVKKVPVNTVSLDSRLSMYKSEGNSLCRTPHIKKPLTVKTPKSAKGLVRRPIVDSRRTPLKAVGQLGTPKYQSPKSILKTRNVSRHA